MIKVSLLRVDAMNGPPKGSPDGYTGVAYTDPETAQVMATAKREQWQTYIPEEREAEEITGDRVIVSFADWPQPRRQTQRIFRLNRTTGAQAVRDGAMKKLTPREREVLGLT